MQDHAQLCPPDETRRLANRHQLHVHDAGQLPPNAMISKGDDDSALRISYDAVGE